MGGALLRSGSARPQRLDGYHRRVAAAGFFTLLAVLIAHALLETARDALFLSHLPASRLPLAYFAIALFALCASRVSQAAALLVPRRALLSAAMAAAGLVTAGLWRLCAAGQAWRLGALYVWTGLLATVLVVQLWQQLGDAVEPACARRVYAIAGAGALVGAALGSMLAAALLSLLADERALLLAAAAVLGCGAAIPAAFPGNQPSAPRRSDHAIGLDAKRPGAARDHDRQLALLGTAALLGAVLVTGGDYLFKSALAAAAARHNWQLGPLFARFYAAVNALSLAVQLVIVPRLLRARIDRALFILPALLLLGAAGFSLTLWLAPALLLKAAEGTLRHSVHRTASELMYLPLPPSARERLQAVADTVGQRGGQAIASLLILAAAALPSPRLLPLALTAVAGAWLFVLARLRPSQSLNRLS